MGAIIRIAMICIPAVASFAAVWAAQRVVVRPTGAALVAGWLTLMLAVGVAAMRSANFVTHRLAPLRTLFQMSLVFPDEAPSRFATALRAGTGRQLQRSTGGGPTTDQESAENLVTLLARLGAHDRLTRGHSERVRAYSVMLGEEIGLPEKSLEKLNWAALAHDLGKLDVPPSILNKRGRPNDDEWAVLRGHPAAADKFVDSLRPWLGQWVECATQHHERVDGTGYPQGLRGDRISLAGRIVSIADAFDVMTAARSYKRPFPAEQARAELLRNAGTQFDADLVRSFMQISLPRQRWATGALGWLVNLPNLLRIPAVPVIQNLGNAVAAATISAAAVVASPQIATSSELAAAAERTVADVVAATTPRSPATPATAIDGPVADDASPTTTTTTEAVAGPTTTAARPEEPVVTNTPDPDRPVTTTTARTSGAVTTTVPGPAPTTTTSPGAPTSTTQPPTTTTTPAATTTSTTSTTAAPPATTAVDDAEVIVNLVGGLVAVLANDDFGGSSADSSTLRLVTSPNKGSAAVVGDQVRYTPDLFASGTDSFGYEICSRSGSCDRATVTITLLL